MTSLVTYHLLFKTEVVTPLELDDHCGSALRGNLFESLWRRFCTNKAAPDCSECPLHSSCPVSALVAPLREDSSRGRDIARPYILLPPLGEARRYEPGAPLAFGLTLFGNIIKLFPYLVLSLRALEAAGLGLKLPENHWQRGRFLIKQIESYHPLTGERRVIYEKGNALARVPALAVTAADVRQKAASLAPGRLTLHFLTPTRLVDQERLVRHAAFLPLVHRLLKRLSVLQGMYGEGEESVLQDDHCHYLECAGRVQCVEDATRWEELDSYSRRQKRFTPIGGIIGRATFAGDLVPFRELLTWGELVHVGKNCVKGNGWYTIEA